MRHARVFPVIIAVFGLLACTPSRKSASGFHLPDGDVERGKAAFVALKCTDCHQVAGVADIPEPILPVPVVLGGTAFYPKPDGKLTALIIEPSSRIGAPYRKGASKIGLLSHMTECSGSMTVTQLVDIVAFLQSHYDAKAPFARY